MKNKFIKSLGIKILFCLVLFVGINNNSHAIGFNKITVATEVVDAKPESGNTKSSKKVSLMKPIKKLFTKKSIDDETINGFEKFSVLGTVSLALGFLLTIIGVLGIILALAGTSVPLIFVAFIVLGIILTTASLVFTIIGALKFKKNRDLKGKGFLFFNLGYWGLTILSNLVGFIAVFFQK